MDNSKRSTNAASFSEKTVTELTIYHSTDYARNEC